MILIAHSEVWEGNDFSRGCLPVSHSVSLLASFGKPAIDLKRLRGNFWIKIDVTDNNF